MTFEEFMKSDFKFQFFQDIKSIVHDSIVGKGRISEFAGVDESLIFVDVETLGTQGSFAIVLYADDRMFHESQMFRLACHPIQGIFSAYGKWVEDHVDGLHEKPISEARSIFCPAFDLLTFF